jgi:hypothetical protein
MMNPFGLPQPDFGGVSPLSGQPDYLGLATTPMPQAKPKGGMFGGGSNIGTAIAAALNGYLAAGGNQAGVLGLQQLHQQRLLQQKQALDEQQYAREQADKRSNFTFEQDYKAQHPTAGAPGEFEQSLIESGIQPGTPQWTQAMKTRVNNILDPAVMTPQGLMLRSQVVGAMQPQTAPPGVTFTPLDDGGPTQPASGNFPY